MESVVPPIIIPTRGLIVQVRQPRYLVEDVVPGKTPGESTLVAMSCVDDDAQGQSLDALWENEVDAQILEAAKGIGRVIVFGVQGWAGEGGKFKAT